MRYKSNKGGIIRAVDKLSRPSEEYKSLSYARLDPEERYDKTLMNENYFEPESQQLEVNNSFANEMECSTQSIDPHKTTSNVNHAHNNGSNATVCNIEDIQSLPRTSKY